MADKFNTKLKQEVLQFPAASDGDLVCDGSHYENCWPGEHKNSALVKSEVEKPAGDVKPYACHETWDSLLCVDSVSTERSADNMYHLHDIKKELAFEEPLPVNVCHDSSEYAFKSEMEQVIRPCSIVLRRLDEDSTIDESCGIKSEPTDQERQVLRGPICGNGKLATDSSDDHNRCPICSKIFSRFWGLKQHLLRIHLNEKSYKCTLCEKSFNVKYLLTRHIRSHRSSQMYSCDTWQKSFSEQNILDVDSLCVLGDRTFKCDKCDFCTVRYEQLKLHVQSVHLDVRPHQCPHCNYSCSESSDLTRHIKAVHQQEKPFKCSVCHKKFMWLSVLKYHMRSVHNDEKHSACDKCDYNCLTKQLLVTHQIAVHDKVKTYPCSECEYKSVSKSGVKRHLLAVHYKVKPWLCTQCNTRFVHKGRLNEHISVVHERKKPYKCEHCRKRFGRKVQRHRHTRITHYKIRPYTCEHCGKSFGLKYHQQRHIQTVHNGVKPHSCQHCDRSFSRKDLLNKHTKNVHGITDAQSTSDNCNDQVLVDYAGSVDNQYLTFVTKQM